MESLDLARQALRTLAPFVAQGALAKIGENTTDRVTQLIRQAWGLLTSGVRSNPKAASALDVYRDEPDDQRNLERLAQHLAAYLQHHHQAVDELRAVVGQLQQQVQTAGIQVSFTNSSTNFGQQAGVNYGTMTQHQQDIHTAAPNLGAQGTFQGPVTFNQPHATFNQQGQQVQGNQYNTNRDLIQSGGDVTQVGGDQINAQGSQGLINRPTGPVTQTFGDSVHGDQISGDITVGDVSGTGIAIGHGASTMVQQGGDQDALTCAFAQIYAAITARPPDADVDQVEIAATVKNIEQEAQKGEQANENKLTRWLRNLAGMAEDIFEVTVAALTGPQAAFATVARKVAAKAKQEREQE